MLRKPRGDKETILLRCEGPRAKGKSFVTFNYDGLRQQVMWLHCSHHQLVTLRRTPWQKISRRRKAGVQEVGTDSVISPSGSTSVRHPLRGRPAFEVLGPEALLRGASGTTKLRRIYSGTGAILA